jgi:hypothetical protein
MTSTPSTQSPSPTRGGSVGQRQFRELALASVDDPNITLAIFEWSAEGWLRRRRLGRDC